MIALALLSVFSPNAEAASAAIDPQVQLHLGASFTDGLPGLGVTGGMDARLTRFVFVDIGGVVGPIQPTAREHGEDAVGGDYFLMRHAVYFAPGLRLPHKSAESFQWDVIGRVGPAVVWNFYDGPSVNQLEVTEVDAAGFVGVDVNLRSRAGVGGRLAAKAFGAFPHSLATNAAVFAWAPHVSAELLYQF